jgi:hypothetical protein
MPENILLPGTEMRKKKDIPVDVLMAERVGFEPTVTCKATTLFESAPINHSGTSPYFTFPAGS